MTPRDRLTAFGTGRGPGRMLSIMQRRALPSQAASDLLGLLILLLLLGAYLLAG
ncbi:MAG: hypothetical protein M3Q71_08820 [Chloroflexota bacterium]|nr:hypothetical protein [Chloroflexota bacterium]